MAAQAQRIQEGIEGEKRKSQVSPIGEFERYLFHENNARNLGLDKALKIVRKETSL